MKEQLVTIALSEIKYNPKIYPREKWNTHTVDVYVDVIKSGQKFPPLILEKDTNELLDGVHRWKAYLKYQEKYQEHLEYERQQAFLQEEKKVVIEIPDVWSDPVEKIEVEYHEVPEVVILQGQIAGQDLTQEEREKFDKRVQALKKLYAAGLSAKHGDRITSANRKEVAREVYENDPDFTLSVLAKYLSVSVGTSHSYVSDILARRKEAQKMIAFRLSLLGWTQEEIGEKIGVHQTVVGDYLREFSELKKALKNLLAEGHPHLDVAERYNMPLQLVWAIDLEGREDHVRLDRLNITLQPYDVWTFGKCHDLFGRVHPGRIPGQLIAHILYFFTKPGEMVIDPMCGGGTTQDVCLAMGRKCYGYDLDSRHERSDVILHNLYSPLLNLDTDEIETDAQGNSIYDLFLPHRLKKANLIFWDPPYFKKMDKTTIGEEGYIEGSISNLNRDAYLEFFEGAFFQIHQSVKPGTKLAFLMSDWDDDTGEQEGIFLWHYAELLQDAGWSLIRHIQVPLSTQQVHPDIVTKFRESRRLARLERYLLIGEKR